MPVMQDEKLRCRGRYKLIRATSRRTKKLSDRTESILCFKVVGLNKEESDLVKCSLLNQCSVYFPQRVKWIKSGNHNKLRLKSQGL